jgi:hypothetical protein
MHDNEITQGVVEILNYKKSYQLIFTSMNQNVQQLYNDSMLFDKFAFNQLARGIGNAQFWRSQISTKKLAASEAKLALHRSMIYWSRNAYNQSFMWRTFDPDPLSTTSNYNALSKEWERIHMRIWDQSSMIGRRSR